MKLQENEFVNFFREYPFDDHWSEILSKPSPIQPSIHLLMVKRAKEDLRLNFRKSYTDCQLDHRYFVRANIKK